MSGSQVFAYTPPTQTQDQSEIFIPSTPPPPQRVQRSDKPLQQQQQQHAPAAKQGVNQLYRGLQPPLTTLLSTLKALPPPTDPKKK